MKQIILFMLLISLVIVSGCDEIKNVINPPEPVKNVTVEIPLTNETSEPVTGPVVEETPIAEPVEEVNLSCADNTDCDWDKVCIDDKCGTVNDLYKTEGCDIKCNFNSVVVGTSDGQTMTLNRGKGSYTAAGAIEWTLSSGPDYCQGEDVIVPVKIKKKNAGKILSEQYVTVKVGENSPVIKHPDIAKIKFTFEVSSVKEVCK
jgi:hypothetical protein